MWYWPPSWGRDRAAVAPEEAERTRRHCCTRASAYASCLRANGAERGPELCARLEAPLLLCYAGRVAPREAAAFQACLTGAAAGSSYITGVECAERLEDVKRALRRARFYPEQLAGGARTR